MVEYSKDDSSYEDARHGAEELGNQLESLSASFFQISQNSKDFSKSFEREMTGAMRAVFVEGQSLSTALKSVASSMADRALNAAITPISQSLGASASQAISQILPFAKGGAFSRGGQNLVSSPHYFPLSGGKTGVMGEAGPEAIMPLSRGADGRLGIAVQSQAPAITVNFHIQTENAQSFRASQSQIARQMRRVLSQS